MEHNKSVEEILKIFKVDHNLGLTSEEAKKD